MKIISSPAIILAALVATSSSFQTGQHLTQFKSSFTNSNGELLHRPVGRNSVRLNMMFDQLANALTDVAKNFGQKKR